MLRNFIIDALRKGRGCSCDISIIDYVLDTSKVIEETTLTRETIGRLED